MTVNRTRTGIALMLASAFSAGFGQLFWKLSATNYLYLIPGFALYALGALLMLRAYRYGSLSVLQPVLSVSYVLSAVLGALFLSETVSIAKIAGILLICAGVVFIARGDRK